jgi:hypothetical protein
MAFTVTSRHVGKTNFQTVTTDSVTPTASSLLIGAAIAQATANVVTQDWLPPTGGSLSYTEQAVSAQVPWAATLDDYAATGALWWAAVGSSPSAFAITLDALNTATAFEYDTQWCDVTGHDSGNPVVQSKAASSTIGSGGTPDSSSSGTIVLDAPPTAGSLLITYFGVGNDAAGAPASPTAGSGKTFTTLGSTSTTFTAGILSYRICDGTESATITCSDLGESIGQYVGLAIEIRPDSASVVAGPARTPLPFPPFRRPFGRPVATAFQLMGDREAISAAAVSLSDTGSGADALTVSVTAPLADTGTGADALTVTATAPLSDTGSGADALSVTASVPLDDTGSGADLLTLGAVPIALDDTGSGADALVVSADIPLADTAAAAEALAVTATVSLDDTGSGSDSLTVQTPSSVDPYQAGQQIAWMFRHRNTASLQLAGSTAVATAAEVSLSETGAAVDALAVTATAPLSDTGSGTDALAVTVTASLSDSGSGADALIVTATVALADTASGAEALSSIATVPLSDTGTGADSLSIAGSENPQLTETGSGSDELVVIATVPLSDTGSGADALVAVRVFTTTDTATGADALTLSATVPLSEAGAAVEALAVTATSSLTEAGTAVDALSVEVIIPIDLGGDTGTAAEALTIFVGLIGGVLSGGQLDGSGVAGGTGAGAGLMGNVQSIGYVTGGTR